MRSCPARELKYLSKMERCSWLKTINAPRYLHRCNQRKLAQRNEGREHIFFPNNRILLRGLSANAWQTSFFANSLQKTVKKQPVFTNRIFGVRFQYRKNLDKSRLFVLYSAILQSCLYSRASQNGVFWRWNSLHILKISAVYGKINYLRKKN